MSQQQFRLSSSHKKNFGIMAVVGMVLFLGGLALSNVTWPADAHGSGHHGAATHEDKKHIDHSTTPANDGIPEKDEHGNGGGQNHGEESHKEGNQHIMHFMGHTDPHDVDAHPKPGDPSHGDHGHGHVSDHQEDGTWRRAFLHEGQEVMAHHSTHVTNSTKIGASLLVGTYWWVAVALFGVFFIAVGYMANAGWYVEIKRVLENYYRFLPIGAALLAITFAVFGKDLYAWIAIPEGEDFLIDGKRAVLNLVFLFGTAVLLVGMIYPFAGHMFKKNSLAEEAQGGLTFHNKSIKLAAIILPIFALGFSFCCFLWLMSVDPHWFSTIYAVYCFAGLFVSGMTITMFITTHLHEKGFMPHLSGDHLHDMGKFMFAFSVFWAYIWISQYLLIWYANIPEETIYYWQRLQKYPVLFGLNVAINFAFPFIALMTRKAKRQIASLRSVGRVMLFGRFLDAYLLVAPGVLGEEGGFTTMMMAAGVLLMVGSIFLFVVFKGFEDAPLEATKHPYFDESVHHSTGI